MTTRTHMALPRRFALLGALGTLAVSTIVITSPANAGPGAPSVAATAVATETVQAVGSATFYGSTGTTVLNRPLVGIAARPQGDGYWLVASDGGVFSYGAASFHGSLGALILNKPVVGGVSTPSGDGYWLVASDGGVFTFGDAGFHGSLGDVRLNQPIVGIVPTPSGQGYWLVASDGGVFTFGDAGFYGSLGTIRLNSPVVGGAATATGLGYYLVAADGGIFTFGDAGFQGSLGSTPLPAGDRVVAMAAHTGGGYWIVGSLGDITAFGGAPALTAAALSGQVVLAAAASPGGTGLWLAQAAARPDLMSVAGKTILVDPGHNGQNNANASYINQIVFIGNGYKECDTTGTQTNDGYPEHAFTFDVAVRLRDLLQRAGANVVFTRPDDNGVGPCITQRAAIGNNAHADAAISIHGDGGPADGRGFHVLYPQLVPGYTDAIVGPSTRLALDIRRVFGQNTAMPQSTYIPGALLQVNYLGGLNMSTVPKIFIECGNMRNAIDADMMKSADFRQQAADALAVGIAAYLAGQ